jgi:hypothetical protein
VVRLAIANSLNLTVLVLDRVAEPDVSLQYRPEIPRRRPDAHALGDAHTWRADEHADAHTDPHADPYADPCADKQGYPHADAYTDQHTVVESDEHADTHSDQHVRVESDQYANGQTDENPDANTDAVSRDRGDVSEAYPMQTEFSPAEHHPLLCISGSHVLYDRVAMSLD